MRLICPNCGAQYEVADDVIPNAGRDVQCSNCGHTWFENRGASEAAEMGTPAPQPEATQEPAPVSEPEPTPEPQPAPEPELEVQSEPEAPRGRELDPEVADILREEAEFEKAARQADDNALETQTDLDLSRDPDPASEPEHHDAEEDRRGREARDRLARLRGEPDVAAAVGATMAMDADAPRRELLPDIEEINSSLRPDATPTHDDLDADMDDKPRSGFRRGFMFVIILVLIALAIYIFAPQISAAVPQLEAPLTSYVNWVDGLRLALDQRLQGLIDTGADAPAAEAPPTAETEAPVAAEAPETDG